MPAEPPAEPSLERILRWGPVSVQLLLTDWPRAQPAAACRLEVRPAADTCVCLGALQHYGVSARLQSAALQATCSVDTGACCVLPARSTQS